SAISSRKQATRSSALLMSRSIWARTRCSSPAANDHSCRAMSPSRSASATRALRLTSRTTQFSIASAENWCASPDSRPDMSPGKVEAADLARTVVENLVGAHRAADDLVDIVGRLVLAVDLGIAGKRHRRSHELDLSDEAQGCDGGAGCLGKTRRGPLEGSTLD